MDYVEWGRTPKQRKYMSLSTKYKKDHVEVECAKKKEVYILHREWVSKDLTIGRKYQQHTITLGICEGRRKRTM